MVGILCDGPPSVSPRVSASYAVLSGKGCARARADVADFEDLSRDVRMRTIRAGYRDVAGHGGLMSER